MLSEGIVVGNLKALPTSGLNPNIDTVVSICSTKQILILHYIPKVSVCVHACMHNKNKETCHLCHLHACVKFLLKSRHTLVVSAILNNHSTFVECKS